MVRYLKGFKLSGLWTCPRSIEASCAQRTKELLKFADAMFEDMQKQIDDAFESDGEEQSLTINDSSVKTQRLAVEKIRMFLHMISMQSEIFRRAVQSKQDKLRALEAEKSRIEEQIEERLIPTPLPTLPTEILGQIFSHLYWSESVAPFPRTPPGHSNFPAVDCRTTLQRFLDDDATPIEWKSLINKRIPCVITTLGAEEGWRTIAPFFGPHPRTIRLRDLHEVSEDILEMPSTAIFINLSERVTRDLESIRQKPWHNVLLSEFRDTDSSEVPREVLQDLVQNFGEKLSGVDHLSFFEISPNTYDDRFLAQASSLMDTGGTEGLSLKPSYACLPPHLIPTFRPIMSNITELETSVPMTYDFGDTITHIDHLLQVLMLCSNTLTSIVITNGQISGTPSVSQTRGHSRVSFPQLKRLSLNALVERSVLDILSAIECPSLRHLTLSMCSVGTSDLTQSQLNTGIATRISASFLHGLFPDLESISANLGEFKDAQFLSDLASPSGSGSWLFPLLDTMKFGSGCVSVAQLPLLRAVTKVVHNRMRSDATKNIRSLSITEFRGAESTDCDALRLFVPEIRFIPDVIHSWGSDAGW
ncbi:hypothetical protein SCHPADRAFT_995820 [Schizopora paradoxa]|uniref:Uncharacterized protein n=1 Tax=Schizopora paradoxa TaxID=27342 RepID=A0A0H2RV41_9AGAM|nr:hypothetical protein SCHPADRAFT_995820 [Schizopora paradoxa]